MSVDELLDVLQSSQKERSSLDAIELVVTLRKPEEYENLIRENTALSAENQALKEHLKQNDINRSELIGLYSRIKHAKKILKDNGLPTHFLDR